MEVYFIIAQAIGKPKKFKLSEGEYIIIGRDRDLCQVPIADDMCSVKHCRVSLTNNCVYIEDMDSKNGIYLNGVRVLKQRIFKDDKIKMGDSVMYINPEKLSEQDLAYLSYQGQTSRKNKGYTLELAYSKQNDSQVSQKVLNLSRKQASQKQYKQDKQKVYSKQRGKVKVPISKEKLQVLEMIAMGIDIFISIFVFYIGVSLFKVYKSGLYDELSKKFTEIDILFSDEMFFYTFGSFVAAAIAYSINRSNKAGSIGEKVLKID